jgi:formate-dependent nitrite reductase membrane component NrfD
VSTPETSDRHFIHSFSIVLGILIVFTILLFAFARVLGKDQNAEQLEDPLVKNAAAQNTMPLGHEAIAGQDNSK